ncbi:MAG: winged helix-turn-helix domain-containing protein [Bacillota bacterium]|nr:winged helix-turn-helix domain-containing protein [Bacillota bacterium]
MAMPAEKSLALPLLRVIADAGGELSVQEAVDRVVGFFPELTEEDKQQLRWSRRVEWARLELVHQGLLHRGPRGIWRITPEGRAHLDEHWASWRPEYSIQRPPPPPPPPEEKIHEHLKELLYRVGSILGYHPEKEFREGPYRYDVVWKDFPGVARASRVFEVQDKGSLEGALVKLQHASHVWGSVLFLVVTGERDQKKIQQYVGPLLAGPFHQLAASLVVLSPDQVEELHETLSRNQDLWRRMLKT